MPALTSSFTLVPYKVVKVETFSFNVPFQKRWLQVLLNFFTVSNVNYSTHHTQPMQLIVLPRFALRSFLLFLISFKIEMKCIEFTQSPFQLLEMEVQSFRNRLISYLLGTSRKSSGSVSNSGISPAESILANDMSVWLSNHPKSRRGNSDNDKFYDRVEGMLLDLTGQINEVSALPSRLS